MRGITDHDFPSLLALLPPSWQMSMGLQMSDTHTLKQNFLVDMHHPMCYHPENMSSEFELLSHLYNESSLAAQ